MKTAGSTIIVLGFACMISLNGYADWFKGNTHTHTWWSDGDSPPENVSDWYKENGYNFLVLSDHNIMLQGEKWHTLKSKEHQAALALYKAKFGEGWAEQRERDGATQVRLKTLEEFRATFEEPGKFMFIVGEEITDNFGRHPVHLNGINLVELIMPRKGSSIAETIQNNVDAVLEQSKKANQPMLVHLNHPNFMWGNRVEDFIALKCQEGEGFFEIYNGHSGVRNYGDEQRPGVERMWDIVLAKRLGELDMELIYGVATDDAHEYTEWGVGITNPGRGWVMVNAEHLDADMITQEMINGNFYASTGVTLTSVIRGENRLSLEIQPEPNVEHRIEFIGTKKGTDLAGTPRENAKPDSNLSLKYSDDIGIVLQTTHGLKADYALKEDDLYVRARVTSTKLHPNPYAQGDFQQAWTQPVAASK